MKNYIISMIGETSQALNNIYMSLFVFSKIKEKNCRKIIFVNNIELNEVQKKVFDEAGVELIDYNQYKDEFLNSVGNEDGDKMFLGIVFSFWVLRKLTGVTTILEPDLFHNKDFKLTKGESGTVVLHQAKIKKGKINCTSTIVTADDKIKDIFSNEIIDWYVNVSGGNTRVIWQMFSNFINSKKYFKQTEDFIYWRYLKSDEIKCGIHRNNSIFPKEYFETTLDSWVELSVRAKEIGFFPSKKKFERLKKVSCDYSEQIDLFFKGYGDVFLKFRTIIESNRELSNSITYKEYKKLSRKG